MTAENGSNSTPSAVQFPPVPLLSGTRVSSAGDPSTVVAAAVTLHLLNGETTTVPLEYRFGGWWVPDDFMDL